MLSISIASSNSIRPKPLCSRSRARMRKLSAPTTCSLKGVNPSADSPLVAAYAYSAINAQGLELKGEVHAAGSPARRASSCAFAACSPSDIDELPASGEESVRTVFKKIKPKSIQIFSRQFATMIEAGLSVVSALTILEEQTDDKYLSLIVKELRA